MGSRKIILGVPSLTVTVGLGYNDAARILDLATKITTSDGEQDFSILDMRKIDNERRVKFTLRLTPASLRANYLHVHEELFKALKFDQESSY